MKKQMAVIVPFFNPFNSELMALNVIKTVSRLVKAWDDIFVIEIKYTDKFLNQNTIKKEVQQVGAKYIQLKCRDVMFHKEQMINLIAKRKLRNYEIVAYVDADILFENFNWPNNAINILENFDLVQCFEKGFIRYIDDVNTKSVYSYMKRWNDNSVPSGSPGGAWAGTKKFWDIGLFDKMILGPNDSMLAEAISNKDSFDYCTFNFKIVKFSDKFDSCFFEYRDKISDLSIGYIPTTVKFQFHGKPKIKRYGTRMLIMTGFDPEKELILNKDGLYEWVNPESKRAELVKTYFESREKEDNSWDTPVNYRVVNDTTANGKFYSKDQEGEMPICFLNHDFEIIWN